MTPEEIREKGLTKDEVMEREFVDPQRECEWLPEWDEYPEERPGENARLEDGVLFWERDGFDVRLESHETTHWKATVSIPEYIGKWHPRPVDLKCRPLPEYGTVESVETDGYTVAEATLLIQANYQPVFEVNKWIDDLIERAEESEEYQEEVEEMLSAARENEA